MSEAFGEAKKIGTNPSQNSDGSIKTQSAGSFIKSKVIDSYSSEKSNHTDVRSELKQYFNKGSKLMTENKEPGGNNEKHSLIKVIDTSDDSEKFTKIFFAKDHPFAFISTNEASIKLLSLDGHKIIDTYSMNKNDEILIQIDPYDKY